MNDSLYFVTLCAVLLTAQHMKDEPAATAKETKVLERIAVQGTDRQLGLGIAEFPPYAVKPRHKAIGPEIVYVLTGEVTLIVDGRPARVIHTGESYQLAADDIHTTEAGPSGAKTIASWVTFPGKPFNIDVSD